MHTHSALLYFLPEIDMPKEMEENADEDEEDMSPQAAEESWTDTGLERFAADQQHASQAQLAASTQQHQPQAPQQAQRQ